MLFRQAGILRIDHSQTKGFIKSDLRTQLKRQNTFLEFSTHNI